MIQLHCKTLLAKDALQSSVLQKKQHLDDVYLDSLERYSGSLPLSLSVSEEKHSDDAVDLDNLRRNADPSPYIIDVPKRKPQKPNKSRRLQIHSDDRADLDNLRRNADPSPYIIDVPKRKPQTSSKSRRYQIYLDDAVGSSGLHADSVSLQNIITIPNHKLHILPSNSHSVDAVNLNNLKWYVITVPQRKSESNSKRTMYSDISEEYLDDVLDEFSNGVEEYSDDVSDQYSDAFSSSFYGLDSVPQRSNTLLKPANIGIKSISAIPKMFLLDDDDEKPKRSHYEEVKTIIKCPQGTELVGDHCRFVELNNKATEIKKL